MQRANQNTSSWDMTYLFNLLLEKITRPTVVQTKAESQTVNYWETRLKTATRHIKSLFFKYIITFPSLWRSPLSYTVGWAFAIVYSLFYTEETQSPPSFPGTHWGTSRVADFATLVHFFLIVPSFAKSIGKPHIPRDTPMSHRSPKNMIVYRAL